MSENQSEIKTEARRWFRFYAESINDPKVQRLPAHLFKTWVNLLCLACSNGGTFPAISDIAFQLRMSDHEAQTQIDELIGLGLIDITADRKLEPHNWSGRQFLSDTSAQRVRKHRAKKAESSPEQPCNVTVTPPDTDTDTDTDTEKEVTPLAPQRGRTRGSRLESDWQLPEDWRMWARTNYPASTDEQVFDQAAQFRDYWCAKPGAQACKLDWEATWRNWCRKGLSAAGTVRKPQYTGSYRQSADVIPYKPMPQPARGMTDAEREAWILSDPELAVGHV
jgi:hypothetical protein